MFDYTTERIVNAVRKSSGKSTTDGKLLGPKNTVNGKAWGKVGFTDGWSFDKKDNADIKVYVRPYLEEIFEQANFKITIPEELKDVETVRFTVTIKQEKFLDAELQNPLTRPEKTYMYDVAFGDASAIGAAIEKAYKEQTNLSQNAKFELSNNAGTLTITMKDASYRVKDIKLEEVTESTLGIESTKLIQGFKKATDITSEGRIGFGTPSWILNNFRLPTPEHTGWETMYKDERPEPNGKYCQVTFIVTKDRGPLTGSATVGQKLTSTTTHVLYVESACWTDLANVLNSINKAESGEDPFASVIFINANGTEEDKQGSYSNASFNII